MIIGTVENSNDGVASTVGWQPLKRFRVVTENLLPLHVQAVRELQLSSCLLLVLVLSVTVFSITLGFLSFGH